MAKTMKHRLKGPQAFQLAEAVRARIKEFGERNLTMPQGCKELAEGLGFDVCVSNLYRALDAVGLAWPKAKRKKKDVSGFGSRDLLDAVVRELLKLSEDVVKLSQDLGQPPPARQTSPTLVRYYKYREEQRNASRRGSLAVETKTDMLPFVPAPEA